MTHTSAPETPVFDTIRSVGQSLWLDDVSRSLVDDGALAAHRDGLGISGVTANPTILAAAVEDGDRYADQIAGLVADGCTDPEDVFWTLAVTDLQGAADVLRPVHDDADGADGFACLEVAPDLADDANASVVQAVELHRRLDRPNAMVKVPGTDAGVTAIEALTYEGVPVNVTLLFSVAQWAASADAYRRGLERRRAEGRDLRVPSVASVFVSRIDDRANQVLPDELHNLVGVATCQAAYAQYRDGLTAPEWKVLADAGARPQRLLWASTGTKDDRLPDLHYVEELLAPETVNTLKPATLDALSDRPGESWRPIGRDATGARDVFSKVTGAGLDLDRLAADLQRAGVESFTDDYRDALATVEGGIEQARST